jgi:hypothetical protein
VPEPSVAVIASPGAAVAGEAAAMPADVDDGRPPIFGDEERERDEENEESGDARRRGTGSAHRAARRERRRMARRKALADPEAGTMACGGALSLVDGASVAPDDCQSAYDSALKMHQRALRFATTPPVDAKDALM